MAELARRLLLPDVRGDGSFVRVTWHPERRLVVLSHWHDDVCVSASRLAIEDAAELIAMLANALRDAAGPDEAAPAC